MSGSGGSILAVGESSENYLETILILSKSHPVVRSVDVAEELGFKKSSVSVAMKNLREREHITVTKEGYIYLTESGREIAEMIYERHQLLSAWLVKLGVDEKIAAEDACKIEHVISKESFDAIKKHVK
ncbi:iron dependent repressor, DNA binding domain protein [Clostridium sp. KLE 1755]|uniref:metal-dependent transcriptional regulator n=1 Tax=Eisenbergiella massiliensis TaxID=1720294 RepID=UPI0003973AA4|nr:iron dependent repressor, DNA binding domain protein [Clostridium sp. KLE 1755]